jgi:hypothetical protein
MLDPKEEKRFEELKSMCRELKVPAPPEIIIKLQVHDKNGILTFDDKQRGHSWTRNFYNYLFSLAADGMGGGSNNFGAGYMSGKDILDTVKYSASSGVGRVGNTSSIIQWGIGSTYGLWGAIGIDTQGIVVGIGDTAFSPEQNKLVTGIVHGITAGTLSHAEMNAGSMAYTGGTTTWAHTRSRIFNNNSGGSITVKEVGLYLKSEMYGGSNNLFYMMERSVLAPTVAVANGAQLTVTYEISMDFSAID